MRCNNGISESQNRQRLRNPAWEISGRRGGLPPGRSAHQVGASPLHLHPELACLSHLLRLEQIKKRIPGPGADVVRTTCGTTPARKPSFSLRDTCALPWDSIDWLICDALSGSRHTTRLCNCYCLTATDERKCAPVASCGQERRAVRSGLRDRSLLAEERVQKHKSLNRPNRRVTRSNLGGCAP